MSKWVLTNKEFDNSEWDSSYKTHSYSFFKDGKPIVKTGKRRWFVHGTLRCRNDVATKSFGKSRVELLDQLFEEYGDHFIHKIKGSFIIIRLDEDGFVIYSDHFAIIKYFYWQSGANLYITNDLKELVKHVTPIPSARNIALYAVTYHAAGGTTLFENIYHNTPGQSIEFRNGKTSISEYWNPCSLLLQNSCQVDIADFSSLVSTSIQNILNDTPNSKVSLSLTGGADTRNLLAVILSLGVRPHLYTYGNPQSDDGIIATRISRDLKLDHTIHDVSMDVDLFTDYAKKILRLGGGLASIHRAHRLFAIEKESKHAEIMFLGTMGGEFIKGVSEDDYITPSIIYENWQTKEISLDNLNYYFDTKFLNRKMPWNNDLIAFLNNEPYLTGSVLKRKQNTLSHITAHLHDAQDINLYSTTGMKSIYTPFMDIDYLDLLFSSQYAYTWKEKIQNRIKRKVNNPVFASKFIAETYPPLLRHIYSGEHKPSEVLFNKYYAAAIRTIRRKIKPSYPPNFPLGKWMHEFVKNNLKSCSDYDVLQEAGAKHIGAITFGRAR